MDSFIKLSLVFIILLAVNCIVLKSTEACPDFEGIQKSSAVSNYQRPKLLPRLGQPRKQLEKYINYLEPNVILVNLTNELITIQLDCWAPYPIDLQFSGHLTNQETKIKTFRKDFGTHDKPVNCFIINATMESYEEITGNYTCNSVDHPSISSSFYIFVSPTRPGVILTRGQQIYIQPNIEDKAIVFPCAVSRPEVGVHLYMGGERDAIPLSEALSYDPKVGFIMDFNTEDMSIFGSYSCRTELGPDDIVNITLLPPKKYQIHPPISDIRLAPDERLNISCRASEEFTISYPKTLQIERNSVVEDASFSSDGHRYKYLGSLVSHSPLPSNISGVVSCQWNNSGLSFAQWTFSVVKKGSRKPGHLDVSKFQASCRDISEIVLYDCSNSVECHINSCVRKDSTCRSQGRMLCLRDDTCMKSGLIQCPSRGGSTEKDIFFTGYPKDNTTNRYVDWMHAPEEELLLLQESTSAGSRKFVKEFTCQGSNFVFSSGFHWAIIYDEGKLLKIKSSDEVTKAPNNAMSVIVRNSLKTIKSNLQSKLTISFENVSTTITRIECYAPIWNSWEWMNQSISVNISWHANATNAHISGSEQTVTASNSASSATCTFLPPIMFLVIFLRSRGTL